MSPEVATAVIIGGLLALLLMGLEIAWSMGIIATIGLFFIHQSPTVLALRTWDSLDSFVLVAVPLFVFMGAVLGNSGVGEQLFFALEKWVGRIPGGLAVTTIVGQAVFGAMSGSVLASIGIFGKIAVPSMAKRGYDPSLALGSVAVGGILAYLIPPSILMIVYGAWQGLPIVTLFAAGLIPGLLLTLFFVIYIIVRVKLNPSLVPHPPKYTWNERWKATLQVAPFAIFIVVLLGIIFKGIMTPSEAAAMGAFMSLVLCFIYKRGNRRLIKESLLDTAKVSSFALFIVAMATALSHVFNSLGITPIFKEFVLGLGLNKYMILVLFYVLYLAMGCFFDSWSMLFITFPLVMPIIIESGINPILWGVLYVIAGEQSGITPPFGMSLFVLRGVCPQYSINTIVRGALPFLIPIYIVIALVTFFPQIALWFPNVMGFRT